MSTGGQITALGYICTAPLSHQDLLWARREGGQAMGRSGLSRRRT